MDTATTVPGIGERKMLLVSSDTFSGMYEFNSAANLDMMRTWNYISQKNMWETQEGKTLHWRYKTKTKQAQSSKL